MTQASNPAARTSLEPPVKRHVCLLHADYHVMLPECWRVTVQWFMDHQHLTDTENRDAYQAEAERRMLDQWLDAAQARSHPPE
ncbi:MULTISPECIES: hypothetical protein [unclassified Streptomyces]|uniref:hypothetical protein n=1 Tax=unclassified Streptomyces TaxID=2593676 RepID=UPI0033DA3C1A